MEKQKQSGSGLIFAVVLLFVILGMVVTLSSVTVLETKMNQKTKSSVGAFYGSESGVEWALNKIATNPSTANLSTILDPTSNLASCPAGIGDCKVYFLDSAGKVMDGTNDAGISETIADIKAVRSVGSQGGETQRAIEAAVAATGGGCYVDYSLPAGTTVGDDCGSGFKVKKSNGKWGSCWSLYQAGVAGELVAFWTTYFLPPGGTCDTSAPPSWRQQREDGEAWVCCM